MTVRALSPGYDFPSRSRAELYGDDQLVNVLWRGNMMFCSAACFRVPKAMTWAAFVEQMVDPWAGSDPGYVPGSPRGWVLDGRPLEPDGERTLADLGVGHKSLLEFTV